MNGQGTKIGSAYIEITGDGGKYRRMMSDIDAQTKRSAAGMRHTLSQAEAGSRKLGASITATMQQSQMETRKLAGSFHGLRGILATVGGVMVGKAIIDIADKFSLMRSRIRLVTQAGEDMLKIEEQLTAQAMVNRADLKSTIDLYTRLRQSRKDLTDSAAQNLVDLWSKTLIISASSAQEAASSTLQFSQAMAAGVLQGQELRSVIQGNGAFAVYLAEGLGITTGELKKMGETGAITMDRITDAMKRMGDTIEHDFAKKALTVHQALINVETAMIRWIGLMDQGVNGSATLAGWINVVAMNFDRLGDALIEAGKAAAIGLSIGVILGMVKALRALSAQMLAAGASAKAMGAAMAFLGGPWGIVLGAIAAGVISIGTSFLDMRSAAEKAQDSIKDVDAAIRATDEIVRQWELDQAAQDLQDMGEAAHGAADGVDALNAALARNAKQQQIDSYTLQARQLQMDILSAQGELGGARASLAQDGSRRTSLAPLLQGQIKEIEARIVALKAKQDEALARADALARIPVDRFGSKDAPATSSAAAGAPTAKTVAELSGYYTALETYERDLADIRAAAAEGAEGANRAIIQSMMDYLEAGGSLRRVLEDVGELSGDMLDPKSVEIIKDFLDAMRIAETIDVPDALNMDPNGNADTGGARRGYGDEGAWAFYEQRVAEATKYGLLSAVETGDWGEAFGQILTDVTREALSNALDVLWQALSQIDWNGDAAGGTGWGGMFDAVGGMFKSRAGGGPVSAGDLVRVGELGSEWFVPRTDGYIIPHGAKAMAAPVSVSIGAPTVIVNGNADSVTRREIAETLGEFTRALPGVIDARVKDRRKRGDY